MTVPKFLYGTAWKEESTQQCVSAALAAGFRGIDTANQRKHYYEAGVGEAIRQSGVTRSELFLQTKFTFQRGQDHRLPYDPKAAIAVQVKQSFESSLKHLHTTYLDSLVLHGPTLSGGDSLVENDWEAWYAMEELHKEGKVHALGISNVNLPQLRELYEKARVKPSFAQIRCYARNGWDIEIRKYCREKNIVYQGFSLLTANKEHLNGSRIKDIAKRYNSTPAQIIFAFVRQVGMLPLTGTTDPEHMKQDLESLAITLETHDLKAIEEVAVGN